jgi:hypothetical protein
MKRIVCIAFAALSCLSLSAQQKQFKEALLVGRNKGEFFKYENTSNSGLKLEDVQAYANSNGYYLGNVSTKYVNRFGGSVKIVSSFEFLPKSDYYNYLFECAAQEYGQSMVISDLKNKGEGCIFLNTGGKYFHKIGNIPWTGDLSKGKLNGKGIGWIPALGDNRSVAYVFKGNFNEGFPVGKMSVVAITLGKNGEVLYDDLRRSTNIATVGELVDNRAPFQYKESYYGFLDGQCNTAISPRYTKVLENFKATVPAGQNNYAVVIFEDNIEWKVDKDGNKLAYSDRQQKIFDDRQAAIEQAERERQEEARLAAEKAAKARKEAEMKAAEERRLAMEKQRIYNQKVKENSDPSTWDVGDRLCLVLNSNRKEYITGSIEDWNSTKTKVKIKIITSPGARRQYNGENLEKNTTMWVATTGEGWHKILPEEQEYANKYDNSTYVEPSRSSNITTTVKCPKCDGKGHLYGYKCYECDGTGLINRTQTISL